VALHSVCGPFGAVRQGRVVAEIEEGSPVTGEAEGTSGVSGVNELEAAEVGGA